MYNWETQLQEICDRQPLPSRWGRLMHIGACAITYIREATEFEWSESNAVKCTFGGCGVIKIHFKSTDGWWDVKDCYVEGGPACTHEAHGS